MDFYCPGKRLAVEIEGSVHNLASSKKYDSHRERYLQAFGIKIIKFNNQEIFTKIGAVINGIRLALQTPS